MPDDQISDQECLELIKKTERLADKIQKLTKEKANLYKSLASLGHARFSLKKRDYEPILQKQKEIEKAIEDYQQKAHDFRAHCLGQLQ